MRDAQTQGDHALRVFEAAWDDEPEEQAAQLEALDNDHLYHLVGTLDDLHKAARTLWLQRTTRPRGEVAGDA